MDTNGPYLGGYDVLPSLISLCGLRQATTWMPLPMAVNKIINFLSREGYYYFDYIYDKYLYSLS